MFWKQWEFVSVKCLWFLWSIFMSVNRIEAMHGRTLNVPHLLQLCKVFAGYVQASIQSSLALWAPRYYGHPANTDSCWIPLVLIQKFRAWSLLDCESCLSKSYKLEFILFLRLWPQCRLWKLSRKNTSYSRSFHYVQALSSKNLFSRAFEAHLKSKIKFQGFSRTSRSSMNPEVTLSKLSV